MPSIAVCIASIILAFTSAGIAPVDAGPSSAINWWIGILSPRERSVVEEHYLVSILSKMHFHVAPLAELYSSSTHPASFSCSLRFA